jgi:hypothetical protein
MKKNFIQSNHLKKGFLNPDAKFLYLLCSKFKSLDKSSNGKLQTVLLSNILFHKTNQNGCIYSSIVLTCLLRCKFWPKFFWHMLHWCCLSFSWRLFMSFQVCILWRRIFVPNNIWRAFCFCEQFVLRAF